MTNMVLLRTVRITGVGIIIIPDREERVLKTI